MNTVWNDFGRWVWRHRAPGLSLRETLSLYGVLNQRCNWLGFWAVVGLFTRICMEHLWHVGPRKEQVGATAGAGFLSRAWAGGSMGSSCWKGVEWAGVSGVGWGSFAWLGVRRPGRATVVDRRCPNCYDVRIRHKKAWSHVISVSTWFWSLFY